MFTIRNTGSIAQMIAEVRDIPARVIPYAASTALTRCAQRAQKVDLPAEMRRVFSNPTPYAINSLFVQPSTKDTLSARVMVKNTAGRGVVPENFLFPEVVGGSRKEKGFEKALRYGGFLHAGESAIPARDAQLDAYGNVSGPLTRSILAALGKAGGGAAVKGKRKTRFGNGIFSGQVGKARGIWQRNGKQLKMLFVFTSKAPVYRQRLDFTATVEKTAQDNFKNEFYTAAAAILGRTA